MSDFKAPLTQFYIGYFGRAPEPEGLAFWEAALESGFTLLAAAQDFGSQAETLVEYPFLADPTTSDLEAFLTTVYANLFSRTPDSEGLEFWVAQIEGGLLLGTAILSIIEGAVGDDITALQNKVDLASSWTELAAGEPDFELTTEAIASSRAALALVTADPESVAAAESVSESFFNDAPNLEVTQGLTDLSEDADTSARIKLADIAITDDGLGTNKLTLTGADAALFEIDGNELFLSAGAALDFETLAVLDVTVEVDDAAIDGEPEDSADLSLAITDVNEAPAVIVTPVVTTLSDDADTAAAIKVADISIIDDALGSNDLTLTGDDAALFEIVGTELFLRAGTTLDAVGNASLDVKVLVDDAAVGATPDDSAPLQIAVTDLNEDTSPPTSYTNLVVFGDSLSDNGNFSDLAGAFLLAAYGVPFQYDGDGTVRTYDTEAFTDGTAYADTMAGLLELDASYYNYAIGGGQALGTKLGGAYINEYTSLTYTTLDGGVGTFSIVENEAQALAEFGDFDINLAAQVDRYISDNPGGAPDGTLAVLNIGANDFGEFDTSFFNILLGGANDFAGDLGVQIETQARRLFDVNVAGVALYTLPVAEFFIGYSDLNWLERPVARDLIDSVNEEITYTAIHLNADGLDTDIVRLDVVSVEIMSDMQTYGFLYDGPYLYGYSGDPTWIETSPGVIEPVFDVNPVAAQYRPEQILFFDEIHPSGALHDMLAAFSAESLSTDETFGTADSDVYDLTSADDFVLAHSGNDVANLGGGNDVALGGTGNDTLRGQDGSDLLIGGVGGDSLQGGDGSDLLAGSAGDDQLSGGLGADMLIGGLGSDTTFGDAGDDIFIFFEETLWGGGGGSTDIYDGGDGMDILLVFLTSSIDSVTQQIFGNTSILSFTDGSVLNTEGIETVEFFTGLPGDAGSPIEMLGLSGDLMERYGEGQLWGIV